MEASGGNNSSSVEQQQLRNRSGGGKGRGTSAEGARIHEREDFGDLFNTHSPPSSSSASKPMEMGASVMGVPTTTTTTAARTIDIGKQQQLKGGSGGGGGGGGGAEKRAAEGTRRILKRFTLEFVATVLYSFFTRLAFSLVHSQVGLGAAAGAAVYVVTLAMGSCATLSVEFYLAHKIARKRRKQLLGTQLFIKMILVMFIQYAGSLLGIYVARVVSNSVYTNLQSTNLQAPLDKLFQHITEGVGSSRLNGAGLAVITFFSMVELSVVFLQNGMLYKGVATTASSSSSQNHHHQVNTNVATGRALVQALAVWIIFPVMRYYTVTQWLAELTLFGANSPVGTVAMPVMLGKLIGFVVSVCVFRLIELI